MKQPDTARKILNYLRRWYPELLRSLNADVLSIYDNTVLIGWPTFDRPYDTEGFEISFTKAGVYKVMRVLIDGDNEKTLIQTQHNYMSIEDFINQEMEDVSAEDLVEKKPVPQDKWKGSYRTA